MRMLTLNFIKLLDISNRVTLHVDKDFGEFDKKSTIEANNDWTEIVCCKDRPHSFYADQITIEQL